VSEPICRIENLVLARANASGVEKFIGPNTGVQAMLGLLSDT
jgi:hypothetical protein